MELQELVSRGRMLFAGAPKRLEVFKSVNGRLSGKEIARKCHRRYVPTLQDLQKMRDLELVRPRRDSEGKVIKKDRSVVYEKLPLISHIPLTMFFDPIHIIANRTADGSTKKPKRQGVSSLQFPNEKEILDICREGEDQIYEFKSAGTEAKNLSREIAAFANTKQGGLIFYGVEGDGTIVGTDRRRQQLDQSLQNSVRNTVSPCVVIDIRERDVLGLSMIIVRVPAWNRKEVFQYDGRVLLRKGTNVFVATPDESKKLHKGVPVV